MLEIGNQPYLCWAPSQPFPRLCARSRNIGTYEEPEEAEMSGRFLGRLGDDWHFQASAYHLGDFSKLYTLFGDRVIPGVRTPLLKRQAEEVGSIEPMHRRPTVEAVTHVRRNSLLAG